MPIERGLKWGVSATARVELREAACASKRGARQTELVHDDRLMSAALVAELDRMVRAGEWFVATGESAVIREEGLKGEGSRSKGGWR